MFRALVLASAVASAAAKGAFHDMDDATFEQAVHQSGKSSFIKFYAPWCGHCKALAPAWGELEDEHAGSSSVVVGTVDCTSDTSKKACGDNDVKGYPTLKYFTPEGGRDAMDYQSGRDLPALKKFVTETLAKPCEVADQAACDDKEVAYIAKQQAKDAGAVKAELARLSGMKAGSMKPESKAWLVKRIAILEQL